MWNSFDQATIAFSYMTSILVLFLTCLITAGPYEYMVPVQTVYITSPAHHRDPLPTVTTCPHCRTANAFQGRASAVVCYNCGRTFTVDRLGRTTPVPHTDPVRSPRVEPVVPATTVISM